MKKILYFLLFLTIAIWLGIQIKTDPGFLLLTWHTWTVEMPLWFALIAMLIIFIVFYFVLRLLKNISRAPLRWHHYKQRRRKIKAQHLTNKGLIEFIEGYWENAEKHLLKGASNSETPLINYLVAARVAQERGDYQRRDEHLRQAHACVPNAKVAIGLTQAQLQLHEKQNEQALATLKHLQEIVPHHPYVIKLLKSLYIELKDWRHLLKLLPAIRKYKVLSNEKLESLEIRLYQALLTSAKEAKLDDLQAIWERIPKNYRKNTDIVIVYVEKLLAVNASDEAETLLRDALKQHWDNRLIKLYGLTQAKDATKLLKHVETWLKEQPNQPALLLAAGRICLRNELWGKAQSYLEASIHIEPNPETYYELAKLAESQQNTAEAFKYYKLGLANQVNERG